MGTPLILLSNDDGIKADGLRALIKVFRPMGDLWVVAPDRERSAMSQAISLHNPLRLSRVGKQEFALDGTPTDCVYVALNHLLPRMPDLVVSGINHGPNLGNDVRYSGTVAAAMEGALSGVASIAISLCLSDEAEMGRGHFSNAAAFAGILGDELIKKPAAPGVVVNVNVPNNEQDPKGVKVCRLGYTDWAGSVQKNHDPRGKPYYWIGGERRGVDNISDSDNSAISQGYISLTPLHYDLTDHRSFQKLRNLSMGRYGLAEDGLGDELSNHPVHHPLLAKRK